MNLGAVVTGGMRKPLPETWLRAGREQGGNTLASLLQSSAGVPHADPGPGTGGCSSGSQSPGAQSRAAKGREQWQGSGERAARITSTEGNCRNVLQVRLGTVDDAEPSHSFKQLASIGKVLGRINTK